MAVWGIAFGLMATITGVFVLEATRGGFLAEGFFLLVIFWVLVLVLVARVVNRLRGK